MKKYPAPLIILHWLTVLLVALVAFMGYRLEDVEFSAENFVYFRNHALAGMLIFLVTLVRMFFKRKYKEQLPTLNYYSDLHKMTVNGVHFLIYLMLLLIPLTGFINVYQTGAFGFCFGKPFPDGAQLSEFWHETHEFFIKILFVSVAAHVAGVFAYSFKNKEKLLKRMCLFSK